MERWDTHGIFKYRFFSNLTFESVACAAAQTKGKQNAQRNGLGSAGARVAARSSVTSSRALIDKQREKKLTLVVPAGATPCASVNYQVFGWKRCLTARVSIPEL